MNEEEFQEWTITGGFNDYVDIPRTWFEVNAFGQVRDVRTKDWYGNVVYRDDLHGVVSGELPAYDPYTVLPNETPEPYFKWRYRNEVLDEDSTPPDRPKVWSAERFFGRKGKTTNIAISRREDIKKRLNDPASLYLRRLRRALMEHRSGPFDYAAHLRPAKAA